MAERRRAPTANPVAARASSGEARRTEPSPDERRELGLVDTVRAGRERQHGRSLRVVGHEHQRLHDLPHVAADRLGGVGRRLGPLGNRRTSGRQSELHALASMNRSIASLIVALPPARRPGPRVPRPPGVRAMPARPSSGRCWTDTLDQRDHHDALEGDLGTTAHDDGRNAREPAHASRPPPASCRGATARRVTPPR